MVRGGPPFDRYSSVAERTGHTRVPVRQLELARQTLPVLPTQRQDVDRTAVPAHKRAAAIAFPEVAAAEGPEWSSSAYRFQTLHQIVVADPVPILVAPDHRADVIVATPIDRPFDGVGGVACRVLVDPPLVEEQAVLVALAGLVDGSFGHVGLAEESYDVVALDWSGHGGKLLEGRLLGC